MNGQQLAATGAQARVRLTEDPPRSVVGNPTPLGLSEMNCTIEGAYHDRPYCFGNEQSERTRISAPIHGRSTY
jgi:hypothetical protein